MINGVVTIITSAFNERSLRHWFQTFCYEDVRFEKEKKRFKKFDQI